MREGLIDITVQPLKNMQAAPFPRGVFVQPGVMGTRWYGGNSATGSYTHVASPTLWGPRYVRKTWTAGGGQHNGDTGFDVYLSASGGFGLPVSPGQKISIVGLLRPSVGDKIGQIAFYWYAPDGSTFVSRSNATFPAMTANVWNQLSSTATVPAGVGYLRYYSIDVTFGGALWAPGDTLDYAASAVYYGETSNYYDGNTPGWNWTGSSGISESVGYPTSRNLFGDSELFHTPERIVHISGDDYIGNYGLGTFRTFTDPTHGKIIEATAHDPTGVAGPTAQIGGVILRTRRNSSPTGASGYWADIKPLKVGDVFTASAEIRTDTSIAAALNFGCRVESDAGGYGTEGTATISPTTNWVRYSRTLTVVAGAAVGKYPMMQAYALGAGGDGYTWYMRRPQIEMGSVATNYVPSTFDDNIYGGVATSLDWGFSIDGGTALTVDHLDLAIDGGTA